MVVLCNVHTAHSAVQYTSFIRTPKYTINCYVLCTLTTTKAMYDAFCAKERKTHAHRRAGTKRNETGEARNEIEKMQPVCGCNHTILTMKLCYFVFFLLLHSCAMFTAGCKCYCYLRISQGHNCNEKEKNYSQILSHRRNHNCNEKKKLLAELVA